MRHSHLSAAARLPRPGSDLPAGQWPPLVAVAHGSTDPRAGGAIADLVAAVRERAGAGAASGAPALDVRAAFLGHSPPSAAAVLAALAGAGAAEVVVLPLLLTAAYHSGTDLPGVLREARGSFPRLGIGYGEPLGPHPLLTRALERRLAEAGGLEPGRPAADTAIVLAAAGSSSPAANAAIARMAAEWQAARGWRTVLPAYASAADPSPGQAVAAVLRAGARHVLVASYLLAPGLFADRIRDASLAAGAHAVSAPLGAAPEVAEILLSRYAEARGAAPERLAAQG